MMNIFTKERILGHPGSPRRRNRRMVQFILSQTTLETDSGGKLAVTVSGGVACTTNHASHSAETIYRLADEALYLAKKQGRNRIVIAR